MEIDQEKKKILNFIKSKNASLPIIILEYDSEIKELNGIKETHQYYTSKLISKVFGITVGLWVVYHTIKIKNKYCAIAFSLEQKTAHM